MSIIIAVRKNDRTVMAADTLTTFGESQQMPPENVPTAKIRRVGASLVGASGWGIYDRILDAYLSDRPEPDLASERAIFVFFMQLWRAMHDRFSLVNDQAQSKDSPFGDLDASFLVANASGMYKVSTDMDVSRFHQYYAIGSGAEYALGALYDGYPAGADAEAVARRAVETAIAFDVYCGGAVTVMHVGTNGE